MMRSDTPTAPIPYTSARENCASAKFKNTADTLGILSRMLSGGTRDGEDKNEHRVEDEDESEDEEVGAETGIMISFLTA